ncbi:MAG: hypothetical protein JXB26_03065 [Candidatus Aminicenantes bacterium]|nr:hypothetical protein [Candidatus Aminicenantes bacterium]
MGRHLPNIEKKSYRIWIHAVSVGEILSLQNLVNRIAGEHPDWDICVSVLTPSGMRIAQEKIKAASCLFFVPFDFKWIVRRFFLKVHPDIFVLTESELWPNLIRVASKKTHGVLVINGRMSERAFRRHYRFRLVSRRILSNIFRFMMQTQKDAERLIRIGVDSRKVEVTGNLKCEVVLSRMDEEEKAQLKKELSIPPDKVIIIAGSTRSGEEAILIEAFVEAKKTGNPMGLIVAPRHPERVEEIEKLSASYPVSVVRKTSYSGEKLWDILILDTLGELTRFYDLSNAAFIGGSLVPWGGHNFLEPAFFGKPFFFGPHMDNFEHLAEIFIREGAARIVRNRQEVTSLFIQASRGELVNMGRKAQTLLQSLQGATEKTIKTMEKMILSERNSRGHE